MLTYLRYALAAICFVLSVACLGMWWVAAGIMGPFPRVTVGIVDSYWSVNFYRSELFVGQTRVRIPPGLRGFRVHTVSVDDVPRASYHQVLHEQGLFDATRDSAHFPLWYPALVFALAGIGALRLGRFTIRSAIIATTVVAGLMGMVVAV